MRKLVLPRCFHFNLCTRSDGVITVCEYKLQVVFFFSEPEMKRVKLNEGRHRYQENNIRLCKCSLEIMFQENQKMYILFCFIDKEFWLKDCASDALPQQGTILKLSDGVPHLFGLRNVKSIFVRKAYIEIDQIIEKFYKENVGSSKRVPTTNIILTGTPGVGKTCFLLHQLCAAKHRGRNVVVQVGNAFTAFISTPEPCVWDRLGDLDREYLLSDNKTLFFYDPGRTNTPLKEDVEAFTIVYASMNPENYRRLNKSNKRTLFMPVWSLQELEACSTLCRYTDNDEVKTLYEDWGGSPRCIFDLDKDDLLDSLNTILRSKVLMEIVADVQEVDVQWLVHISIRNDDYTKSFLDFPSQFVKQQVVDALAAREVDWKTKPSILAGRLFEFLVGKRLVDWKGGMRAISLNLESRSDLEIIPPMASQHFANSTDLTDHLTTTMYIPIESNKCSIDFVLGNVLFQATIARSHDVKAEGIIAVSHQFQRKEWNLCFCLPTVRFCDYKKQTITHKKLLVDAGIKVVQYKLEIKD